MISQKKDNVLKLMWKMIMFRPWMYALSVTLWTLIFVYNLVPGLISREFLNRLFSDSVSDGLFLKLIIILVTATVLRFICGYYGGLVDRRHDFITVSTIRVNIMEKLYDKYGAIAINTSSGEVLDHITKDVEQLVDTLGWLLDIIGTATFSIVSLAILISINAKITLLVFGPLIIVALLTKRIQKKLQRYRRDSRKCDSEVSGMISEIFHSILTIKAFNAEEHLMNKLCSLNRKRHKMIMKDTVFSQMVNSVFENTVNIGTGLILFLVANMMKTGSFQLGDLVLYVYCLSFVADFSQRIGDFLAYLKQTEVSVERLCELIEEPNLDSIMQRRTIYLKPVKHQNEHISKNSKADIDELKVENLSYTYKGSNNGIRNINLNLKKDSITVITGRIGSGKSTLVKVLTGLLPVGSGQIYIDHEKVKDSDKVFVPPMVAYTPQAPKLFSGTIESNILHDITMNETEIKDVLYYSVLDRDIDDFENGLYTFVGTGGMKLSGGQIQRVAMARMFARNANIYVLDDVSSALDVGTEKELWTRFFERNSGTYIIVSNKKEVMKKADNIVVMENGEIIAQGNIEELVERSAEFRRIIDMSA